jgi:hypothetical protein
MNQENTLLGKDFIRTNNSGKRLFDNKRKDLPIYKRKTNRVIIMPN